MTTFFSKDELKEEFTSGETYKGILGYKYLFKMSVYEITQDTGSQRVESVIHENVTGFENVRYISQKDSTTNG